MNVLRAALLTLAAIYVAVVAVSFLPDHYWAFETLSNIRVPLAMAGVVGAVAHLITRLRMAALGLAALALVQSVVAFDVTERIAGAATTPANLRVMTVNISFGHHRDDRKLVAMIKAAKPDVLVLIQDFPEARREIAKAVGFLPYHAEAGIDLRAVSIDSRYPIDEAKIESRTYVSHILTCQMTVPAGVGTRQILFIATHPSVPIRPGMAGERKLALSYLAERAAKASEPVVIAGDFNTTPQSVYFTRLLDDGHLADTARARLPEPTWLSSIPGFGLRIDHVLVSPDIAVAKRAVGADFGSDHRAVIVDLTIPPAA